MNFARNIITDLREKHLLPVAVLLLVAAVALPFVLKKGSESPKTTVATAETATQGDAVVDLTQQADSASAQSIVNHRELDELEKKNPFSQQETITIDSDDSGSVTPTDSGSTSDGGATTGGGDSGSTTGDSGSDVTTTDDPSKYKYYRWTVTVRFGLSGRTHPQEVLSMFSLLPSAESPVITFFGVSNKSGSAVFGVSDNVGQEGEGTCQPSNDECSYVYMRPTKERNEHNFWRSDDPDRKFSLKLNDVELKETSLDELEDSGSGSGSDSSGKSSSVDRKRSKDSKRPFAPSLGYFLHSRSDRRR